MTQSPNRRISLIVTCCVGIFVHADSSSAQCSPGEPGSVVPVRSTASQGVRSVAVRLNLDVNHDLYLTRSEIEIGLRDAIGRRNLLRRRYDDGAEALVRVGNAEEIVRQEQCAIQELDRSNLSRISLVQSVFRSRFGHLPERQKDVLLLIDWQGDNDGELSLNEYLRYKRRGIFRRKGRFEREFGAEAHEYVLGELQAP